MRETFIGVLPFLGAELIRVALLISFPLLPCGYHDFFPVEVN